MKLIFFRLNLKTKQNYKWKRNEWKQTKYEKKNATKCTGEKTNNRFYYNFIIISKKKQVQRNYKPINENFV